MPNTSTLRIWGHVRQIRPAAGQTDAWFSLNLAPVFIADNNAATAVDINLAKKYLEPWTWKWTSLRMVLIQAGAVIGVIPVPSVQVVSEAPAVGVTNVFTDEFAQTTSTFNANSFTEGQAGLQSSIQMNEDSARDWRTWLLHASTYPGDIPLRAGIAVFFHVPFAQLGNADEVVVAPVFDSVPFGATLSLVDPPLSTVNPPPPCSNLTNPQPAPGPCPLCRLKPDLTPYAAPDTNWVTQWNYAAPNGTDLRAQWIQTQAPLRVPGNAGARPWFSDGFIDEGTLWITPSANSWKQDVNLHEELEQRVAGLFDLPSRLLEWADQALQQVPPSTIDAAFGQALLTTMRDLLRTCGDPNTAQILNRPDKGTLAQDIAAVIAPGAANAPARASILQKVTQYYAGFDAYVLWKAHLTKALTDSGQFTLDDSAPGWENPVQTNGNYNDWLKRMHSVRAWLFDWVNLRAFIIEDWAAALADPTLGGARDKVDRYLKNIDLISVLRQGFAGIAWGQQAGGWYAPDAIPNAMSAALIDTYRDRLGLADPPPPAGITPRTPWDYIHLLPRQNGVTSVQQPDLEDYLKRFVTNWSQSQAGPAPAAGSTPDFSRGNQGINIGLSNSDTFGGSDQAFLGNFRGAAVLVRPSTKDAAGNPLFNWSMLNLGQYSLRGDGTDPSAQVAPPLNMDQVVVSPTQILYRNGLRQVTVTWRNQPLSARSPAAALSQVRSLKGDGDLSSTYAAYRQGPFQLWNPYRGTSPFRLPRLVFGTAYDVAASAVGLAGEMAAEISEPLKPWMVTLTPATWAPPPDKIRTIGPYLRTVPVGLVRVEGPNGCNGKPISKLTGPPIPDKTYPMIRSLLTSPPQGQPAVPQHDQDTVILLGDTQNVAKAPQPAAWIPGAVNSMQFFIRPPATDLATFDSWPLAAPAALADRAAIYALLAQHTDITNDGDSRSAPDLTLDDPGVTSFSVTLTPLAVPGMPAPAPAIVSAFPVCRPAGTLLQQYQSSRLPVNIVVGPAAALQAPATCADPYQISVTVAPGTVCQLDIAPVVGNEALFMTGALKLAARTFYIEVASALNVPSLNDAATALNSALKLALTTPATALDTTSDQLQVNLDLGGLATGTPAANLAPQIHRVELMVQRWRWQGRPPVQTDPQGNPITFDFPFTAIKKAGADGADTVLPPYDGMYFGERDSNDQLVVAAQVDAVANPGTAPVLYTYDLSHSPQALYYRFAVRTFSRYEGLFARGGSVESRILRAASAAPTAEPAPEQWRRLLPLCRRTATAPKPAVRLILPLTRTIKNEQTPGLLVVLSEAWYDWAGLAEQFQVQLASVTDTDGKVHLQAGPDPVVSNPDYKAPGTPPQITLESNPLATGPIGFTFDTNTNAPLFPSTSFIVPAPLQVNADGMKAPVDLSWWFLQLQFRRTLNSDGVANFSTSLNSDWTVPMQAQLLPAANLWNVTISGVSQRVDTSTLQAASSAAPGISITDSLGNSAAVSPEPFDAASTNRFEVWALLTVNIQDAFGHAGQEAFVKLVPLASLATLPPSGATTLRLIEIQSMNRISVPQTDWRLLADDLFPSSNAKSGVDPAMARARIVRVSPPIPIFE